MELRDLSGLPRVVLHPVDYEFASATGDAWDDNWLVIAGRVTSDESEWSFEHPSLVVDEAREIAEWLERLANRSPAPTPLREDGNVDPTLAFIEPDLAFSVGGCGENTVVVRVHLALEAFPPDQRARAAGDGAERTFLVEMEIPLAGVAAAAAAWREELKSLPKR